MSINLNLKDLNSNDKASNGDIPSRIGYQTIFA